MKAVVTIREETHHRVLLMRTLERIVFSDEFEEAFARSCESCRAKASGLIAQSDCKGLTTWINESYKDVAELGTRELRLLGRKLGVRNYNRLPKLLLLAEIARVQKEKATRTDGSGQAGANCHHAACRNA